MAKTQVGQCALCKAQKELQLSHIIPHFVGRKLIKTSPGNIRSSNEPNKVRQDIEKHFMLCHECEELFSAKERWFSANIFNPYQDANEKAFNYDENLTYFIISLSWRSLCLDLEEFVSDPTFNKNVLNILNKRTLRSQTFTCSLRVFIYFIFSRSELIVACFCFFLEHLPKLQPRPYSCARY